MMGATLRRDGWVSVDSAGAGAKLVTKFLTVEEGASTLLINANTMVDPDLASFGNGSLSLAVLDPETMEPLSGVACKAMENEDSLEHDMGCSGLGGLGGKIVQLEFTLTRCKLYSFMLKSDDTLEREAAAFGRTPVMGWGSYYGYEHDGKTQSVNEHMIKGQADLLVSTGLAKAGYRMIMPDDGGYFKRDAATGKLNETTEQFPSGFKAMGEYVHSKGLLWGVYSDSGTRTCGPGAGMLGHEDQDAATFAAWGVGKC